ncbi:monocarboxylate transporter 12-B-like [Sycon ciliatum]|uniref:monocarboxylate transporter 12-B-like n=1 Tax=Sycon ciliatum TaxID=27933 RepID=UPI0031F670FD
MEAEILKRGWKEACRKFLLFVSLCCLYCVSFSSDLTSSVSYAELLLDPCPSGSRGQQNGSGEAVTDTVTVIPLASLTPSQSTVTDSACGGFGSSASSTAWVASIYTCVRVGTCWLDGITFEVLGARKSAFLGLLLFTIGSLGSSFANELYILYITRGLISGLGGGLLFTLPVAVIDIVFSSHKCLLMAFASSTSGIGVVYLALAGRSAIQYGGWQWYYRVLGFTSIATMLTVIILPGKLSSDGYKQTRTSQSSSATGSSSSEGKETKDLSTIGSTLSETSRPCGTLQGLAKKTKLSFIRGISLYRNFNFILLVIVYFLLSLMFFVPIVTARHRSQHIGSSNDESFLQVILVGAGWLGGGLSAGLTVQYLPVSPILMQGVISTAVGLSCCLSALVNTVDGFRYFITLYGFLISAVNALGPLALLEIVKKEEVPHAVGQMLLPAAISVLCGPPAAGWLYDISGSYVLPAAIGGGIMVSSGLCELYLFARVQRQKRNKSNNTIACPGPAHMAVESSAVAETMVC